MSTWATVVVTLGASFIAVAGTLVGALLQDRRASSRDEAEARDRRIREGADVVARIEILLSDADPDRLGINVRPEAPFEAFTPLQDDWLQNLRPALAKFALADESSDVRDLGRKLGVAVTNSLIAAGWLLRELVTPRSTGLLESRERARNDHDEARRLLELLMASVRGEATKGQLEPPKHAETADAKEQEKGA